MRDFLRIYLALYSSIGSAVGAVESRPRLRESTPNCSKVDFSGKSAAPSYSGLENKINKSQNVQDWQIKVEMSIEDANASKVLPIFLKGSKVMMANQCCYWTQQRTPNLCYASTRPVVP